jgi:hypothetical protein
MNLQPQKTHFWLSSTAVPSLSPAYDANWEQTGAAVRRVMSIGSKDGSALTDFSRTVPITTSQDILAVQFVSSAFDYRSMLSCPISMVVRCSENATSNNAFLAYSLRSYRPETSAFQAMASKYTTTGATEFALTASAATRIWATQAITTVTVEAGDVLVLELGIRANAPTAAGSAILRFGAPAGTADFALTTALTTDLCPWFEIAEEVMESGSFPNQQYVEASGGLSTNERWRG